MFPFDLDDDEDIVEAEEETTKQTDYEIDFTTGALTGRIISGLPALIQWIRLAIETKKYVFNQFSWDYGCEISDLIGKESSLEYIRSEVSRMLTDTLSGNTDIESIADLDVNVDNDKLNIKFTVNTVYGSKEVAANV